MSALLAWVASKINTGPLNTDFYHWRVSIQRLVVGLMRLFASVGCVAGSVVDHGAVVLEGAHVLAVHIQAVLQSPLTNRGHERGVVTVGCSRVIRVD